MMFMACSLIGLASRTRCSVLHAAPQGRDLFSDSVGPGSASRVTSVPRSARDTNSHPRHIELRLLATSVAPERAVLADRVGALKNPVLPRRQAREYLRFHGFGPGKAQVGFHAGEAVGRERGAFLEEQPDLIVPVDVVEREGDEAKRL